MRRIFTAAFLLAVLVAAALPAGAGAAPLPVPGPRAPRVADPYPEQMPAAGIHGSYAPAQPGGFLTLPYLGDRFVSSNFDHCGPTYARDGVICRFDGTVAYAASGRDKDAPSGYAMTAGKEDYLYYDGHDGIDLGLYYDQVLAAADGVVTFAGWENPDCHRCQFGQGVRIDHGNGWDTLYGHLWKVYAAVGQQVRRGQVIGVSGTTGNSTGEHLHFGVYKHATWTPVDPWGWAGAGADPWPQDAGNLWLGGIARHPDVVVPQVSIALATDAVADMLRISWTSPGAGNRYTVMAYTDDGPAQLLAEGAATSAELAAPPGHRYWFTVHVVTDLGLEDTVASAVMSTYPVISDAR